MEQDAPQPNAEVAEARPQSRWPLFSWEGRTDAEVKDIFESVMDPDQSLVNLGNLLELERQAEGRET